MPCFNGGPYLRPAIESILHQTHRDFEFLIINDCSTDDSLETIRSFGDPRIRVHTNERNMGQTKSLNVGLQLARGKYVVINDADDLSLPGRIEQQLQFMLRNEDCAVVGGACYIMDRSGRITRLFNKPVDPRRITLQILSDTPLVHGSVMMNRAIILGRGGYNEDFRICQDYELWSSLVRDGVRIGNMPDVLAVIRHYMDSISFKESDAQTQENGRTILANVAALTGMSITTEEAIRQRLFFFAPQVLSVTAFRKAADLFRKEYEQLNPVCGADEGFVRQDLKRRMIKPYSKMAMAKFEEGDLAEARRCAGAYLSGYGFSLIPFLLWTMSHVGPRTFHASLHAHGKLQHLKATIKRFLHI